MKPEKKSDTWKMVGVAVGSATAGVMTLAGWFLYQIVKGPFN
jgi:hypothetical protein